jgi:hypothetical protein
MKFMVHKETLGRIPQSNSVSPVNHSTDCSALTIIHYHLGLVEQASGVLSNSGHCSTPRQKGENKFCQVVQYFRQFVAGVSPRLAGCDPKSGHVTFMVSSVFSHNVLFFIQIVLAQSVPRLIIILSQT